MTLVTVPQSNPNDEITALSVNQGPNAIATVVNGQLDDTNISALTGTKVAAGTLPGSSLTTEASPYIRLTESMGDFVASGLVWSATSGLGGAMTAGVAYINGARLTPVAVASYTFTASRDTYIYLDSSGNVQYNPQTNGAAEPAATANTFTLAKVVTNGSTITSVVDLRPTSRIMRLRQITTDFASTTVGTVDVPDLNATVYVTAGQRIKITVYSNASNGNGGFNGLIREGSTQLQVFAVPGATLQPTPFWVYLTPSTGSHTYTVSISQGSAGTMTFRANPAYPAYITVERA